MTEQEDQTGTENPVDPLRSNLTDLLSLAHRDQKMNRIAILADLLKQEIESVQANGLIRSGSSHITEDQDVTLTNMAKSVGIFSTWVEETFLAPIP